MRTLKLCFLFAALLLLGSGTGSYGPVVAQDKKDYQSPALPGGVPVFQPGKDKTPPKDDKTPKTPVKDDDKAPPVAVVATDEGGKMPLKFVKNKLADMKDGEKGYVPLDRIMVDSDRNCWVDINATVFSPTPLRKDIVVQVSKDDKGYHLGLTEKLIQHQWVAVDSEQTKNMTNIKSVKVLASE